MARKRRTKRISLRARLTKDFRKEGLLLLIVVGLVVGAFGLPFVTFASSDWGMDVELVSIGHGGNIYDIGSLPSSADITLEGKRITTLDYDGVVDYESAEQRPMMDYDPYMLPSDYSGMLPRVSHAVGNLFYTNEVGERSLAPIRTFENTTEDLGNVHYYFGFSVMFTTRAAVQYAGRDVLLYHRVDDEFDWLSRQIVPLGKIDMTTTVGIHLQSLTETFQYNGTINEVSIVNERARYTLASSISGVSEDMDIFNRDYSWVEKYMIGSAVKSRTPTIDYGVIDSESEQLATITLGASLEVGVEAPLTLEQIWDPAVYDIINSLLAPYDVEAAFQLQVYNVEYIFDVVIDASLNGVPITDFMADWAAGTQDVLLPADDTMPETPWELFIIIALVAIIALLIIKKVLVPI